MRKVVLLGAGKSSVYIIDYVSDLSKKLNFEFVVADLNAQNLEDRCSGKHCLIQHLSNSDFSAIESLIEGAFLVISMLPASLHQKVAKACLTLTTHLITPSYISNEMQSFDQEAKEKDLIFLNELGLDPGIDHLSVMKTIDEWKAKGAKIIGLKSHCGGLVAPKSDTNLWHYKISWNPRNVVLAGSGEGYIQYRSSNKIVKMKYEDLFGHTASLQTQDGIEYESYPNRDSLKYEEVYGLSNIATLYRGTLRLPPFCKGWNMLVSSGATATDNAFPSIDKSMIEDKEVVEMFDELGVFDVAATNGVAADVLQSLVEKSWKMEATDCDRVVMIHEFEMELNSKKTTLQSSFTLDGKNALYTAMAKTVGLPIAFATELILTNKIQQKGVLLPIHREIYEPILKRLEEHGVVFEERILES